MQVVPCAGAIVPANDNDDEDLADIIGRSTQATIDALDEAFRLFFEAWRTALGGDAP